MACDRRGPRCESLCLPTDSYWRLLSAARAIYRQNECDGLVTGKNASEERQSVPLRDEFAASSEPAVGVAAGPSQLLFRVAEDQRSWCSCSTGAYIGSQSFHLGVAIVLMIMKHRCF
ncbi:hypothetical protein LSAT2_012666 [Lamellibrachia satsuma]|nr:hypothetical protein LSAT2_012666 [Lamellibrachia satsuma]